jgi:hypothetical protein
VGKKKHRLTNFLRFFQIYNPKNVEKKLENGFAFLGTLKLFFQKKFFARLGIIL